MNTSDSNDIGIESNRTILVIEDDPSLNRLICQELHLAGYSTDSASTGASAIAKIISNNPVLATIDYQLPDMTGQQVIEQLKDSNNLIPFIMITGEGDESIAVNMMKFGARDYVVKKGKFVESLPRIVGRVIDELETEKKLSETESKLKDSEAALRNLFETTNDLILSLDEKFDFLYVNAAWCRVLGYTQEEILRLKLIELLPAEQQSFFNRLLQGLSEGQEHSNIGIALISKHGEEVYIEGNMGIRIKDGEYAGVQGIFRDVTQRKHAEEELHRANIKLTRRVKELNCLYELTSLASLPERLERIFQHVANTIRHAWQYPEIACSRIIFDEDQYTSSNFTETPWKQSADIMLSGDMAGMVEVFYLEEMPDAYEGPFLIEERHVIDSVASQLTMICEQRHAESALKESEERHRMIADNAADIIFSMDMNLFLTYVSPSVTRLTGYEIEETLGQSIREFLPPESFEAVVANYQIQTEQELPEENIPSRTQTHELQVFRKDGSTIWIEATLSSIHDAEGRTTGILGIARDITESKQAEAVLKESEERFRQISQLFPFPVWIRTPDGRTEYLNPQFTQTFGYTTEDVPTIREWLDLAYRDSEGARQLIPEWEFNHAILNGQQSSKCSPSAKMGHLVDIR